MRNLLALHVELGLGAVFIVLFAAFFLGFFYITVKNFTTNQDIYAASSSRVKSISATERLLMQSWVERDTIVIPEGEGYRYLIKTYPDKPWRNL